MSQVLSKMKPERLASLALKAAAQVEMDGGGPVQTISIARRIGVSREVLARALQSSYNLYLYEISSDCGRSHGWARNEKNLPPGAVDWSRHRIWRPWVRDGDKSPPERLGFPFPSRRPNRLFPDP